jgi:uncharacterized repeat protein (TIGR02543 family)
VLRDASLLNHLVGGGQQRTVIAMTKSGHTFVHWTKNGTVVSTSPSYTFTMPSANLTLVAAFQ